jgi:hypothetical protein
MTDVIKNLGLIHGAKAIGVAINKSERETFYLLERGLIAGAMKLGTGWCVSEGNLRKQFGIEANASNTEEACA